MKDTTQYCRNLHKYSRRVSRVVNVGSIPLGGNHPIRIQSMTTTNTMDTDATVDQSITLIKGGCEYVRITAPSIREAENLKYIKKRLVSAGYTTPVIADIHFTPNAAEIAARYVEKVRVNPGNYLDKKKFQFREYTEEDYQSELERIYQRFTPLVKICRENGTAIRIGTNHGSLSDRIMSKYGDTPLGMVESAMEFIRMCEAHNFHDIVLSMKSSIPFIMIEANRLLVSRMDQENMQYPIHLGVTEAGEGEDGRVKSAIGIGALLADGIGDTIRVSLTEEPENELPVALKLAERYNKKPSAARPVNLDTPIPYDPFSYRKRKSGKILNFGANNPPRVISSVDQGWVNSSRDEYLWNNSDIHTDYLYAKRLEKIEGLPLHIGFCADSGAEKPYLTERNFLRVISMKQLSVDQKHLTPPFILAAPVNKFDLNLLPGHKNIILALSAAPENFLQEIRKVICTLIETKIDIPVIVSIENSSINHLEDLIELSVNIGGLLVDGLIDGVWLHRADQARLKLIFSIFQTTRLRITRTEFISCPSCGRTLFDLQEVSRKIRDRTDHLKGLKIGIMGCIVNGPGEMADADYGYVGTGVGQVSLYRGMDVVKKNIPSELAVEGLIDIIKKDGKWIDRDNK